MNQSAAAVVDAAAEQLEEGDASSAFDTIHDALHYPASLSVGSWPEALDVFANAGAELMGDEWGEVIGNAAAAADTADALGAAGSFLIEQGFAGVAASLLGRAVELAPHDEALLTELITAHEQLADHAGAVRILETADPASSSGFLPRYLLAFNALMAFDPERARPLREDLLSSASDDTERFMANRIDGMLARLDAVAEAGFGHPERTDLQAWHLVRTGGLLLDASVADPGSYGDGRRATVTDNVEDCRAAISRVQRLLARFDLSPTAILTLPEASSLVVAQATSEVFGLPVPQQWPESPDAPGLIVAYDLDRIHPDVSGALAIHSPGQVLWAHAARWTTDHDVTPDLVTFLHQSVTPPWSDDMVEEKLDADASMRWSGRVAAADDDAQTSDADDRLARLAEATRGCGDHAAGVYLWAGRRLKQFSAPLPTDPYSAEAGASQA